MGAALGMPARGKEGGSQTHTKDEIKAAFSCSSAQPSTPAGRPQEETEAHRGKPLSQGWGRMRIRPPDCRFKDPNQVQDGQGVLSQGPQLIPQLPRILCQQDSEGTSVGFFPRFPFPSSPPDFSQLLSLRFGWPDTTSSSRVG